MVRSSIPRAWVVALALVVGGLAAPAGDVLAAHPSCVVERVIDGDTFVCTDGTRVRLLQINAPELDGCGGDWARAALANIFLRPGTVVGLAYDRVTEDRYGRHLAAPIVIGTDGEEYNISIVMVYVGLARAAFYGDNERFYAWAKASETWAKTAQWNMWAPGAPFNGAAYCE
jgi:endonuclease YncB( thermonuclease family)